MDRMIRSLEQLTTGLRLEWLAMRQGESLTKVFGRNTVTKAKGTRGGEDQLLR